MSPAAQRRLFIWGGYAAVLVVAPLIFNKGFSLSLLCQMGIVMIFALSYNMLLGQTGLLSFGHAVYYGLGALFTIHALNLAQGGLKFPVIVDAARGRRGRSSCSACSSATSRRVARAPRSR